MFTTEALIVKTSVSAASDEGFWGLINGQIAEANGALNGAAWIAAIVIVLGVAYKTKAIMATAIAAVIGAALIFLVSGGLGIFSTKIDQTIVGAPTSISNVVVSLPDRPGSGV
jgi:L-alanine-DL-glutamate epimerase-like enolase superfamily enzyme